VFVIGRQKLICANGHSKISDTEFIHSTKEYSVSEYLGGNSYSFFSERSFVL
jgi:hypothetical protein